MNKQQKQVKLTGELSIESLETFKDFARLHGAKVPELALTSSEIEQLILKYFVNPSVEPKQAGFVFNNATRCFLKTAQKVELTLVCDVFDSEALHEQAAFAYSSCWGALGYKMANDAEALYELTIASNANPSPADIGVLIVDWTSA